jgi:hypothetical protein
VITQHLRFTLRFLKVSALGGLQLEVPKLTDAELIPVVERFPSLQRPLANERLKKLLRIPFILEKATRMEWSPSISLPRNEREFRVKLWREVIRRNDESAEGMPDLRADTFTQIALRRARASSRLLNVLI